MPACVADRTQPTPASRETGGIRTSSGQCTLWETAGRTILPVAIGTTLPKLANCLFRRHAPAEPQASAATGFAMHDTALTRAFFENRQDLIAFLKAKLQCAATADDLCQDIYLKLRRVDDPSAIDNCRGYLFMMAANLVADRLRAEVRRLSLLKERGREAAWKPAQERTPEELLVARAEIDYLNRAVAKLPELSRRIFYANRFESKTQRDIAAEFGVSISTVEYHIRKVLDHLASARKEFHKQI